MSGTDKNVNDAGKARSGVEQANAGNPVGADKIDQVRNSDPATADAIEQEAEDGPPGRGLSR